MSKAATFTDANFQAEVLESNQLVLVDFWAAWCGPCRALGPTIDALAEQYEGEVKIGKLNVDDNPEVASQLGISSIPAVLLFKDGEVIETLVGVRGKEAYEQALQLAAA